MMLYFMFYFAFPYCNIKSMNNLLFYVFFFNIYVCLKTLFVKLQIAHQPSIYALDTLGVLVPTIFDIETRLILALADTILMQIISLVFFFF